MVPKTGVGQSRLARGGGIHARRIGWRCRAVNTSIGNGAGHSARDFAADVAAGTPGGIRELASSPARSIDPQKAEEARQLAEAGHCTQCHGPNLAGQDHVPRLAGQHFEYLRQQLQRFKAASRGDIDGNMTSAAQSLSRLGMGVEQDINNRAAWRPALWRIKLSSRLLKGMS